MEFKKLIQNKFLLAGLIVIIIILTVALIKSKPEIPDGPDIPNGPAIPDGAGQNNFLIKDDSVIPNGGNEIKKEETQEKIIISLPYTPSQSTNSVVPMGETIYHPDPPNPGGHPGIDFQWGLSKVIDIIACHDGEVIFAERTESHNKFDVHIKSGNYTIVYAELENIDSKITQGAKVVLGQRIGEPGKFNGNHYNMHWELRLGTRSICPMNYFNPESKSRIEKDWANTKEPRIKKNAPDICSGYYKDKNE
jgi:hypothetical protein